MKNKTHGGKRKGSGRKKKEPTTTKRVPFSLVPKIDLLISKHRKLSEIKKINES